MRRIAETCGREIAAATGGDAVRGAMLAAITANESGGWRQTYRFVPANYQKLMALLSGAESNLDGLTRGQLEKSLRVAASEGERTALLKRLAGLHGYTQIAGYFSIIWKVPLDALAEKGRHFQLAARRLDELCREFQLDPALDPVELGRCWNAGHPNGRTRSPLYSWRLQERMKLSLEIGALQRESSS